MSAATVQPVPVLLDRVAALPILQVGAAGVTARQPHQLLPGFRTPAGNWARCVASVDDRSCCVVGASVLLVVGGFVAIGVGYVYRRAGDEDQELLASPLFKGWRAFGRIARRVGPALVAIGVLGLILSGDLNAVR